MGLGSLRALWGLQPTVNWCWPCFFFQEASRSVEVDVQQSLALWSERDIPMDLIIELVERCATTLWGSTPPLFPPRLRPRVHFGHCRIF